MKRIMSILFILAISLSITGCTGICAGHDGLIAKARTEIPVSGADTIDITIAGSSDIDGNCLIWFVTGNEHQQHGYYPIEFKQLKPHEADYKFIKLYNAYDRGQDIAVYPWNGFAVLVNNENCTEIRLTYADGTSEIVPVHAPLPFIWSTHKTPAEYLFLDIDGNEIH